MVNPNAKKKTLVLIDGHALAYRSYFALERTGMKTSDKQPTWAVFGFFKAVFDLLKNPEIEFDSIGVAFDVSHQTFRTELYTDYKANREAMPDTLRSQIGLICEGLKAFNIPIYTKEGFEADDVIGTIATRACELGNNTIILTGDQDAFQLIKKNGCIKVLLPSKGELVSYDWDKVHEKLGVYPDQIIDYKALRGDTSDNIPGIKGIGEKTAAKLLSDWNNLDNIYSNIEKIEGNSLRTKLIEGKDSADLSRFLATIKLDVDVDFDFEKTNIELPNTDEVIEFLKKVQFFSFIKNIGQILRPFTKGELAQENSKLASEAVTPKESATQQLGFTFSNLQATPAADIKLKPEIAIIKEIITNETEFEKLIENLNSQTLIGIQAICENENSFESKLIGLSFGYNEDLKIENGEIKYENKNSPTQTYYIPLGHTSGEQLEKGVVLDRLKPILESSEQAKTFSDAKLEINVFRRHGIKVDNIRFDTLLASYVNDPSRKHDIKSQAIEHLEFITKELKEITGTKRDRIKIEDLPISIMGDYACEDMYSIIGLTGFWTKKLGNDERKLLYEIEIPTSLVLADMEYTGVAIDPEYLKQFSKELTEKLENIEQSIYELAGEKFNVNSPKQVGAILFEKLGLKPRGKKRGAQNFSTDAKVLTELSAEHEIASKLLEQRQYSKIKTTYVDALPAMISPYDAKIHTHYNQTITVTGRLSSSDPNLQNIPVKSELGNRIRKAFIPEDRDNQVLLSSDYSQIELRLLAHVSKDKMLIDAFNSDEDIHSRTAQKIFDVSAENVTRSMRSKAKAVNFGIVYGQTRYGLAGAINISPQEAQLFIDKYFETYPKVKDYMDKAIQDAYQYGYAKTLYGRKRYLLDELVSSNHQIKEFAQRAAINSPLQGAAADIIKKAMIELYKKLQDGKFKSKMIMQVHDELILQVYKNELEEIKQVVKEAMELEQPLLVPLVVDIEVGSTWMDEED